MRGSAHRQSFSVAGVPLTMAVICGVVAISAVTCCTQKECEGECFLRGAKEAWCNGMFCICDIDFRFGEVENEPQSNGAGDAGMVDKRLQK
ncbi:hypothetical protein MTO96_048047 [Rhipicephalus appendiculatus]